MSLVEFTLACNALKIIFELYKLLEFARTANPLLVGGGINSGWQGWVKVSHPKMPVCEDNM